MESDVRVGKRGAQKGFKYHNDFGAHVANLLFNTGLTRASPAPLAGCLIPLLVVAGCATDASVERYVPQIITPYRMPIQQGNFVTQDLVDKLAVGQTREQVRFILGTPLLTDVFHARRWDYVFRSAVGWNQPEKRRLVVFFDAANLLERWVAEVPPTPVPAATDAPAPPAPKPAPAGLTGG